MAEAKSKVIIKRPSEKYGHVANISTSLTNLQKIVKGQAATMKLMDGLEILHNPYAKDLGEEFNCKISDMEFYGTIAVVGKENGAIADIPVSTNVWKRIIDFGDLL